MQSSTASCVNLAFSRKLSWHSQHSDAPPIYRRAPAGSKLDPFKDEIHRLLKNDIGVHEYRFVRRYLERRPHPKMFLRQIDPLIRQLTEYRDFIDLKIKEQPE